MHITFEEVRKQLDVILCRRLHRDVPNPSALIHPSLDILIFLLSVSLTRSYIHKDASSKREYLERPLIRSQLRYFFCTNCNRVPWNILQQQWKSLGKRKSRSLRTSTYVPWLGKSDVRSCDVVANMQPGKKINIFRRNDVKSARRWRKQSTTSHYSSFALPSCFYVSLQDENLRERIIPKVRPITGLIQLVHRYLANFTWRIQKDRDIHTLTHKRKHIYAYKRIAMLLTKQRFCQKPGSARKFTLRRFTRTNEFIVLATSPTRVTCRDALKNLYHLSHLSRIRTLHRYVVMLKRVTVLTNIIQSCRRRSENDKSLFRTVKLPFRLINNDGRF